MKSPTTPQSLLSGGSTGGRGLGIWTLMTLGSGLSMEATPGPPRTSSPTLKLPSLPGPCFLPSLQRHCGPSEVRLKGWAQRMFRARDRGDLGSKLR